MKKSYCFSAALFMVATMAVAQSPCTLLGLGLPPANAVTNVIEASDYHLLYEVDLTKKNYQQGRYLQNYLNTAAGNYKRVAYYMELNNQWVWVSMKDFTANNFRSLAIPDVNYNNVDWERKVDSMNVYTNVAGVVTGANILTGNIEMWDNCYDRPANSGIGGNSGSFDFDDVLTLNSPNCYGSFQVHNYGAQQTIFAHNAFAYGSEPNEAGIGNRTVLNPDWTYAYNINSFSVKKLYILVSGCIQEPDTSLTLVSDSSWSLSTVTTTATANSYPWPGVMSTPATPTFTLPVDVGQPYPWEHLYTVDGSQVITAQSGVTYYRNTFDLVDPAGIEARFRMFVDDNMEIFINGHWIALEDDMGQHNWRTVNHDLLFNGDGTSTNGNAGGDAFDYVTSADMDTVFKAGTNEIILAIRNRTSKPDLGGFSFRMDLDKGAVKKAGAVTRSNSAVTADNKLIIFPNPTSGNVTVALNHTSQTSNEGTVSVFDFSGKQIISQSIYSETELNLNSLPAGVYLVKVTSGAEAFAQKVVKH